MYSVALFANPLWSSIICEADPAEFMTADLTCEVVSRLKRIKRHKLLTGDVIAANVLVEPAVAFRAWLRRLLNCL